MKYILLTYSILLLSVGNPLLLHVHHEHEHSHENSSHTESYECIECISINNNFQFIISDINIQISNIEYYNFVPKKISLLLKTKYSSDHSRAPPIS